jgi:hypothetical protein
LDWDLFIASLSTVSGKKYSKREACCCCELWVASCKLWAVSKSGQGQNSHSRGLLIVEFLVFMGVFNPSSVKLVKYK